MSQAIETSTLFDAPKPPLAVDLRVRLSVMMFLEFAIWGAWVTVFYPYCDKTLHLSGGQFGSLLGTMAIGAIISLAFVGQIADRFLPSEYLMAICHLGGAVLLFLAARTHDYDAARFNGLALITHDYNRLWWIMLAYALLYNPTLTSSNTVAFAHIPDQARDFPTLRVLGTIGFIAAGNLVEYALPSRAIYTSQPLMLAAGLSAVLGIFSFVLPHTPPADKGPGNMPFLRALKLLGNPSFAVFFIITFIITISLAFYWTFSGGFLDSLHVEKVATTLTIGQWSELFFMLLLPWALKNLGMKWVLAAGIAAWALRCGLLALGHPYPLVIIAIALHGVSFDFFVAAGFIYTDEKAPSEIRGSAQALFGFIVYGVGMWAGNIISGHLKDHYTAHAIINGIPGETVNWTRFWAIPAGWSAICLVLFLFLWRDRPNPQPIQA